VFNRYYEDELLYLRELGAEFARAYPQAAHLLSGTSSDPDVERLLEGFAFLTARIRERLDDELPEVTHGLMNMLWPHYLRPVPSMSMLEFQPRFAALRQTHRVERGVQVQSVPVEGTACRFRTAYAVDLQPISLEQTQLETQGAGVSRLWLGFKVWNKLPLDVLDLRTLRLHLHGDPTITLQLHQHLLRHVAEARVVTTGPEGKGAAKTESTWRPLTIQPVGYRESEALLDYPTRSFPGYRLLQEYFALPEKFLFLDFGGFERLRELPLEERFWIEVRFDRALEATLRPAPDTFRLYCTPIVNQFTHEADPFRLDRAKVEYRLRPAGANPFHYEISSVDRVTGVETGAAREREFPPFHSFIHAVEDREAPTYHVVRLRNSVVDDRADTYLSFVDSASRAAHPAVETVATRLTCTNRRLPEALRVGDIQVPTDTSPELARFRNLTTPTPSIPPPLQGDLHWRLLSHLGLQRLSLTDLEALRGILSLYDFQTARDPKAARMLALRLEGIQAIRTTPRDLVYRGALLRGVDVDLDVREDRFAGDGDLFLFSSILVELFALQATLNSFVRVRIKGIQKGEEIVWPARTGERQLV